MSKYIDAARLRAEIAKNQSTAENAYNPNSEDADYWNGKVVACEDILQIIDWLQQEQPEESIAKEAIQLVFEEKLTPFKDGNQWCFLLGHNIQDGVCGFGDTILDAAINFHKDYSTTRIHIGELKKTMEQPEVDLDEEADRMFFSLGWYEGDHDQPMLDCISLEEFRGIARHFYELGQRKAKEESK